LVSSLFAFRFIKIDRSLANLRVRQVVSLARRGSVRPSWSLTHNPTLHPAGSFALGLSIRLMPTLALLVSIHQVVSLDPAFAIHPRKPLARH